VELTFSADATSAFQTTEHLRDSSVSPPKGWVERGTVMLGTILIIVLILLLIGALPTWPYSTGWGYYPGGGLGLILIIVIVLVLVGRI
jgi:Protein of unknown function (DUF3309)